MWKGKEANSFNVTTGSPKPCPPNMPWIFLGEYTAWSCSQLSIIKHDFMHMCLPLTWWKYMHGACYNNNCYRTRLGIRADVWLVFRDDDTGWFGSAPSQRCHWWAAVPWFTRGGVPHATTSHLWHIYKWGEGGILHNGNQITSSWV